MSLWVNDRLLTDLVWSVLSAQGQLDPVVPLSTTVQLANAPAILGSTVSTAARRVTVVLDCRPASLVARDQLIDTLAARLADVMELRFLSAPTRSLYATLVSAVVEPYTGAHAQPLFAITLTFEALDPVRRDVQPLVYTLGTTRKAMPLGTAASAPLIWLYGNATPVIDPVVIVRSQTGAEVQRLTLNGVTTARTTASLGTDTALAIDCATQRIDYYVSGVRQTGTANGLTWFGSGQFPLLSPEDSSYELASWPTLELSAASGTPTGLAVYFRGY